MSEEPGQTPEPESNSADLPRKHEGLTWPFVIGSLSILVGAIYLWSAVFAMKRAAGFPDGESAVLYNVILISTCSISGLLALSAGIVLFRNLRIGRYLHAIYAGATLGILGTGCTNLVLRLSVNLKLFPQLDPYSYLRMVAPLLILAYAVFLTAWMARKTVVQQIRKQESRHQNRAVEPIWATVLGVASVAIAYEEFFLGTTVINFFDGPSFRLLVPGLMGSVYTVVYGGTILLLAVAGICLLCHAKRGVLLHKAYAIINLLWAIWLTAYGLFSVTKEGGLDGWIISFPSLEALLGSIRALHISQRVIYSVFLLVWLNRERIKQQISTWARPRDVKGTPGTALAQPR